jgi:hypothetical protein
MAYFITDGDLFKKSSNWLSQIGPNINSVPSDSFKASNLPDGTMIVTNVLSQQMAGGLVVNKRPVPKIAGVTLNYIGLDLKVMFPGMTLFNIARHEIDLKLCLQSAPDPNTLIQNVADFSTQMNFSTGTWQIDTATPWAETALKFGTVLPDKWHTLSWRFWHDPVAKIYSVLSMALDGNVSVIPATMQKIPYMKTNWSEVAAFQAQNEGFNPGLTLVLYDAGVLTYSDQPF